MSYNNNSNFGWSNKVETNKKASSNEDPFASLISMNKSSSKPPTPMASPQPMGQPKAAAASSGSFWSMNTSTVIHDNQQSSNKSLNSLASEQSHSSPPTLSSTPTGGHYSTLNQPNTTSSKTSDPWDLDFLSNASSKSKPSTPIPNLDPFEIDSLKSSSYSKSPISQPDPFDPIPSTKVHPPGDPFSNEDDFLGELGKPYSPRVSSPLRNTRTPEDTSMDFALVQLMDEGFELDAAKIALQLEGNNIELARQTLLQQQTIGNKNRQPTGFSSDEEDGFGRPPVPPRRSNTRDQTNANMPFFKNINQDQIMQQANEFGTNVFSKAQTLFNKSKKKIKETWEEIQSSDFSSATSTPPEFRDKSERRRRFGNYEVDRNQDNSSEDDFPNSHERYRDDSDDEEDSMGYQKFEPEVEKFNQSSRRRRDLSASPIFDSSRSPTFNKQPEHEQDLLGLSGAPSRVPPRQQPSSSSPLGFSPHTSKPRPPAPTRSPKPPVRSASPPVDKSSADAQTLARSEQLRQKGNELFKLGQYDQSQQYYTQAIDILPAHHPNLIPLLNNRSASQLKSGEFKQVVQDCNQIIQLIGPHKNYTPEHANATSLMSQMNLKEHYCKSVIKLGTALEGLEKFNEAMVKYQDLVQLGSSQFLPQANQGIQRCQKALKPKPKPAYKPPAKPAAKVEVNRSEAVQKLRQQQATQDREEDQRLRVTDQVEARVNAWKQGKGSNIRALLSSLHTLLWPELNWKTIGLGDVLTEKQVKISYMRAIGKLHPDKLPQTTTVEQKLMANLVFATLNRSWDEFQKGGN